ncbi:sulfotransferase family 2 domain-containing protein [Vibrio sp. MA40-2]|uniref:sulfotransferase family 2 domain-containing protein n=1 Tax=Vibrio sp. MA40-2 TaxID=3391828 RepID=UPI0039A5AD51
MSNIKQKYWKLNKIIRRKTDPFPHINYVKRRKFLFIHIPKTAGTSILDALSIDFRQHYDYRVYKAANPKAFNKAFKFCFVRNPYQRVISTYNYLKQTDGEEVDIYLKNLIEQECPTFESFVNYFINHNKVSLHPLFRPQYSFIYDIDGSCKVDFIGRFENIADDFKTICQKINVEFNLPNKNRSKNKLTISPLNQELADIIYSCYQQDFILFNYDKDSWKQA